MRKSRVSDNILLFLIWLFAFITMGVLIWILAHVISNGIKNINWEFISSIYKPGLNKYGILPMIISTLYLVMLAIAISTPVGICSAIYLVEYSKPGKILRLIRFATETLSGIPSIIYGLFGYIFFVITLHLSWSLLAGALTLSIMVLPTIIRTTEEALKSIPPVYKEGSLALGATRLQTVIKVILPSAIPGILSAVILSIGRIVGETAAVYLTFGYATRIPGSIMKSGRTLSVHLYLLAKEGASAERAYAYATATILVILVAVINFLATRIAAGIRKYTTGD
jgi:phosphate transport system permease protein